MLQQTQVKTVIPYWERWMRALPDIPSLAHADAATIHKLWEGLGYYTRVRNMQKAAREILARHHGEFPRTHAAILELPGIGPYTAGAIASIAFNQPAPILDGNVIRVLTRLFAIPENPREKTTNKKLWRLAGQLVSTAAIPMERGCVRSTSRSTVEPQDASDSTLRIISSADAAAGLSDTAALQDASPNFLVRHSLGDGGKPETLNLKPSAVSRLNQSLMELGALICTPKQPKCPQCPVAKNCRAHRLGQVEQFPNLTKRAAATQRHFIAFVIRNRDRYLVRQRPPGQVNAHLWEFPNVEIPAAALTPPDRGSATRSTSANQAALESANGASIAIRAAAHRAALPNHVDLSSLAQAHLGLRLTRLQKFCTIKHTITRYRITLEVVSAECEVRSREKENERWLKPGELHLLPFTSAHGKILRQLSENKIRNS